MKLVLISSVFTLVLWTSAFAYPTYKEENPFYRRLKENKVRKLNDVENEDDLFTRGKKGDRKLLKKLVSRTVKAVGWKLIDAAENFFGDGEAGTMPTFNPSTYNPVTFPSTDNPVTLPPTDLPGIEKRDVIADLLKMLEREFGTSDVPPTATASSALPPVTDATASPFPTATGGPVTPLPDFRLERAFRMIELIGHILISDDMDGEM